MGSLLHPHDEQATMAWRCHQGSQQQAQVQHDNRLQQLMVAAESRSCCMAYTI